MTRLSSRANIAPFYAMEVAREARQRAAAGHSIVRFDVGQPHVGAPAAAIAAATQALASSRLGYTEALGALTLRTAIAAHYRRTYDVDVDPARVVITTGASGAFVLAFLALFETGDRVALAAPGYPPYRHILTALGMTPVSVEAGIVDGLHLTPDAVAACEAPLAGVLTASPANPTGALMTAAALAALAAAARARGASFISDEIYHGLVYEGAATTALAVDPDALVINSFSKYWAMTGWRVGWLIAPERLIKPIERLAQNLFICPPAPAQAAALAALEAVGECEDRRALYARNHARLCAELPRIGLTPVVPPAGAFYAMLDVSRFAADSAAFCHRALFEAGVALTPGVDFDEARGGRWVRLAYCVTPDEVAMGIERLADLVARS
jgi:aspartate/methionine/tyrosine aminotransferase